MVRKSIMGLGTINTILNTVPIVIQGTTRLMQLIRKQGRYTQSEGDIPANIDSIKNEVEQLHQRLDVHNKSTVDQIKLIEELARQNESLATQLKSTIVHLNRVTILATAAIIVSIICFMIIAH